VYRVVVSAREPKGEFEALGRKIGAQEVIRIKGPADRVTVTLT
jgi:hypothetical protein